MDASSDISASASRHFLFSAMLTCWYYLKVVRPRILMSKRSKRPYSMINKMEGQKKFLDKLTALNDTHCYNILRMDRSCFRKFCNLLRTMGGLEESKYVSIVEKVAAFLLIIIHHAKHRLVACMFERSCHTVSIHFNEVLNAVLRLHSTLLIKPEPVKEDCSDPVWEYFKGCLGALDGTYIPVYVRTS